ncbi:acetolactate synthase large subunit [Actinotignum timonense]|uniref:acetolactate synthase large subunit n=1 Tax=Actinotignum timonense TaxID=1870995 RepID=UPI002A8356A1|nr:acetolactate synthase large subunit [Actinotignum timonense]MDY5134613.1 acetolactate synthase large subunit [Actinotignum timonense]
MAASEMNASAMSASAASRRDRPGEIREKMDGARAIVRTLAELGVDVVFGLPGGAILPTYDPMYDSVSPRHILVRHEQGGGHAAEGYALATGRVGVVMATSGPGATNLVTPLLDANMDSVPLVAITGQVGAAAIGTDAFQEADIVGATMPMVKHSFLVTDADDIPARLVEAFYLAASGRPGPVLVDIAKSAQNQETEFVWPPRLDLPGYRPAGEPDSAAVREAARLIATAARPVLYVGGGAVRARVSREVTELSDLTGAPVVTTLPARGTVPDSHPHNLGMPGMHGTVPAVGALQRSDLIVALGARFDDRVTGALDGFAPKAKVIHLDIDPAEVSKNRTADVAIIGDLAQSVPALLAEVRAARAQYGEANLDPWWGYLNRLRGTYPAGYTPTDDGLVSPQYVIERLGAVAGSEDTIWVTGVGQHQMWASQFLRFEHPHRWLSSGGAGTMGYGIPAGMGAKVGQPERTVWVIDGDGSFQMTNQELATCRLNNINIKVAVINNSSLGMVRQWQTLFYEGRYSFTDLETGNNTRRIPDFVKLAEAYDCAAWRVEKKDDVDTAIQRAMEINDRPVVIDFITSPDAEVWPMVAAGVSNDEIMYAKGLRPEVDENFA